MPGTYKSLFRKRLPPKGDQPAKLRFTVAELDYPEPQNHEVVVRMGGAPVNPSDLGSVLYGGERIAEASNFKVGGRQHMDLPLPEHITIEEEGGWEALGNEGAGVVELAGKDAECQRLLGKTVFFVGGSSYSQVALKNWWEVEEQPEGVTPKKAAASNVNPITALGMVEKMRREGHSAIVHTAAASQLGLMLQRLCNAESVQLVNIVRSQESAELLKAEGATHTVNSSLESFREDLIGALAATGATIAFDAVGGGNLVATILDCMEQAAWVRGDQGSWYGSSVWKQVYAYGCLDPSQPVEMRPQFGGYRWNYGGYLLPDFLETVSEEWQREARARVARELDGIFRTSYCKEVNLEELITVENMQLANKKGTSKKLLVVP